MIEEILLENNKGWSWSELVRRFNVDRSTIKRDIDYIQGKDLTSFLIENNRISLLFSNHSRLILRYMSHAADGLDEQEMNREFNRRPVQLYNLYWI